MTAKYNHKENAFMLLAILLFYVLATAAGGLPEGISALLATLCQVVLDKIVSNWYKLLHYTSV